MSRLRPWDTLVAAALSDHFCAYTPSIHGGVWTCVPAAATADLFIGHVILPPRCSDSVSERRNAKDRFRDALMSDLLREMAPEFEYLIEEFGFAVEEEHRENIFDYATVILRDRDIRLKLIRERGLIFAEVEANENWLELDMLLRYAIGDENIDFGIPPMIDIVARELKTHLAAVTDVIKSPERLERFQEFRLKAIRLDKIAYAMAGGNDPNRAPAMWNRSYPEPKMPFPWGTCALALVAVVLVCALFVAAVVALWHFLFFSGLGRN